VQQRFHYIPLLGELNYMLTLQRKHDDQLSDDVCQFGNACLVEPQKVIENVDVDKNGVSGVLTLHRL